MKKLLLIPTTHIYYDKKTLDLFVESVIKENGRSQMERIGNLNDDPNRFIGYNPKTFDKINIGELRILTKPPQP